MDIQSFFHLCDGKWISQRTTHHLLEQNNQSGRSDLWGECLEAGHSDIVTLCQQLNVAPSLAQCGLRLRWSEVAEAYQSRFKPRNEGTALLVAITSPSKAAMHPESAPSHSANAGQILRSLNSDNASTGRFSIGADEALTLQFEEAGVFSEERIWFASPNLRLRSSSIKKNNIICITTFCSEIRMVAPAPEESTAAKSNVPT